MKITVLGSGSSSGTPAVGYGWGRCDPKNTKNQRLRPSILVEDANARVLVDTSPDLRQQLLNASITQLDGVLYTHYHADHLHGIDDLRPINRTMNAPLDIFCDKDTLDVIRERFGYVLEPLAEGATMYYKPTLIPHEIGPGDDFEINGLRIQTFGQDHGYCKTLGFRFGDFAYSTDVVELPEDSFEALDGVKIWMIGTLVDTIHPTHAHVDKAVEWVSRVKPEQAFLTHLGVGLDHASVSDDLPDGMYVAFDGQVIET